MSAYRLTPTCQDSLEQADSAVLGTKAADLDRLPLIQTLMDAAQNLDLADQQGFTVDRHTGTFNGECGKDSFHVLLVVDGGATLYCDGEHKTLNKGDCFFLPAGCGDYRVEGNCEILTAYLS